MRGLMERIRRALCRHEWELDQLGGFLVVDGVFRRVTVTRCRKCGKMKDVNSLPRGEGGPEGVGRGMRERT